MNDQLTQTRAAAAKTVRAPGLQNAAQCRAWIAGIATGDPVGALQAVDDRLRSWPASGVAPEARAEILESLLDPVANLQAAAARLYYGKDVPRASHEHDAWRATVDVRLAIAAGYEQCLAGEPAGANGAGQREALICQRALVQLGLAVIDHARAYVAVPGEIWKRLHNLYRHAEARGIAQTPVAGAGTGVMTTTDCRSSYLRALLFHQAQPYSLAPAQIEGVARWLDEWTGLVGLHTEAHGGNPLTALVVDLDSADGLQVLRHAPPGPGLRHVDTQQLGVKVKQVALALREGAAATTKAGEATDSVKAAQIRLLTSLYVQWCSCGTGRAGARTQASGKAMVSLTIPAMHFYVSGKAFRQPGHGNTREEEQDLQLFGHISMRTTQKLVSQRSSALEPWAFDNESANGYFALFRQSDFRTRIAHGQLLGLMRRSDKPIELVMVQRLKVVESGELEVGARRCEGTPQAVSVRVAATAGPGAGKRVEPAAKAKYERALLLPENPGKSLPSRLFLQPGSYSPGAMLDLYTHEHSSIRLLDLIEKGTNFEQVTFETV